MAKPTEEQVARLKELMRIAKVNGLAKTQEQFCEFIGRPGTGNLSNAMTGRAGNIENYIRIAEEVLEQNGINVKNVDAVAKRLDLIEKRLKQIEDKLKLDDETL